MPEEEEWIGAVNDALGELRERAAFVDDAVALVVRERTLMASALLAIKETLTTAEGDDVPRGEAPKLAAKWVAAAALDAVRGNKQAEWGEVLDAARHVQLRTAARELLRLKDGPRDEDYERRKPEAWKRLREAVGT